LCVIRLSGTVRVVGRVPPTRIAVARAERGLTQRDLASLSTVSKTTISRAERGLPPGVRMQILLAKALNREPRDLWPEAWEEAS
jgi:transcriptional regulator with XRE-family HTH domain